VSQEGLCSMQLVIVESLKSAVRYLVEFANKSTILLVLLPNV
jgi:hypothetical protein